MSTLSYENVAVLVRRRLGANERSVLRFTPLIDQALRRLSYKLAESETLRHWALTDPATTTATLTSGAADLTALITTPRILLECLGYGRIYHSSSPFPLKRLNSAGQGQVAGAYDLQFIHYWLEGKTLKLRPTKTGSLSFAVPYWLTLAQTDDSLIEMLVECVLEELQENKQEYIEEEKEAA